MTGEQKWTIRKQKTNTNWKKKREEINEKKHKTKKQQQQIWIE